MSRITQQLYLDFETDNPITEEQFKKFKKHFDAWLNTSAESAIENMSEKCGFGCVTMYPIMEYDDMEVDDE